MAKNHQKVMKIEFFLKKNYFFLKGKLVVKEWQRKTVFSKNRSRGYAGYPWDALFPSIELSEFLSLKGDQGMKNILFCSKKPKITKKRALGKLG